MTNHFIPILFLAILALALGIGGLLISWFIGPKNKNTKKQENYESGIDSSPAPKAGGRFPIRFFLVAMSFIVFDVEIVFMYPWAVNFGDLGWFGIAGVMIFSFLVTIPFICEWKLGALDW